MARSDEMRAASHPMTTRSASMKVVHPGLLGGCWLRSPSRQRRTRMRLHAHARTCPKTRERLPEWRRRHGRWPTSYDLNRHWATRRAAEALERLKSSGLTAQTTGYYFERFQDAIAAAAIEESSWPPHDAAGLAATSATSLADPDDPRLKNPARSPPSSWAKRSLLQAKQTRVGCACELPGLVRGGHAADRHSRARTEREASTGRRDAVSPRVASYAGRSSVLLLATSRCPATRGVRDLHCCSRGHEGSAAS
jgi:hypothetical protein